MLVLGAAITGCDGTHRYDSRLTAADSLMHDYPDSALALVTAIDTATLVTEADRAYRDLLLTQARYKAYIPATSDSDINHALAYYRAHPSDSEKLTRAYIYKGTVMEELGHPDSAMYYYKNAEATAAQDDYSILGQVNVRIANLYRKYYGDKEICFDKYNKALKYYKLLDNKEMQQICLFYMAGCVGITGRSDAGYYFTQAIELAVELNDSSRIVNCYELWSRQLSLEDSTRSRAKRIALKCIEAYPRFTNVDLIIDLAYIYAMDNQLDSAEYFLNIVDESTDYDHLEQIIARKKSTQSIIEDKKGNTNLSKYYSSQSQQIQDSLVNSPQRYAIQHIENINNEKLSSVAKHKITSLQWTIITLAIFSMAIILSFVVFHCIRMNRTKSIINELEHHNTNNHDSNHVELLKSIEAKDCVIGELVNNLVKFMQTSIDASEKGSPAIIRRRIKQTIGSVANEEFWNSLHNYLDRNYNNIITNIGRNPKIKEKDLKFIELSCCGFSYIEIAITLDYTTNYVSQKRKEIAKKLNLTVTLQEYLESLMISGK